MAKYYGLGSEYPAEDSERVTADALKKLGPEWTIIHHVTWQSQRDGRQGDGEADFLVFHPKLGLLIIEVKGGGISLANGRWQSVDRHGKVHEIKNPYDQATASKHALLSWLRVRGMGSSVKIGHAVVFPHLGSLPNLGPAASPEITFTRDSLSDPERNIVRCMKYWDLSANLSQRQADELVGLLAPTVTVRRSLSSESAAAETTLIELTAAQVQAFAGLRCRRGGLIVGNAGTGKTVLAIARAQQLRGDGFKTLLVCYNELLGLQLEKQFEGADGLEARTFHSLCFTEARRAGLTIPANPSREWWEVGAADLLLEACARSGTQYDAVVVDEAQDFAPIWLDTLKCLTANRDDAPFFAFADPKQDLWHRNWLGSRDDVFVFELARNLRNTQPIAEKVAAVLGEPLKPPKGAEGPQPRWRDIRDSKRPQGDVIAAVEHLIDEGFGPGNLVVLCSAPTLVTRLREHAVGPYSFGRWGGRGIPVETIARFKGMEAEAAVLVLEDGEIEQDLTIAYVGLSRPRSVLVAIGTQRKQASLRWLQTVH